jgi:hypothetical protein
MELWQLLGLLFAGAVGIGQLASSSARQATSVATKTPSGSSLTLADSTLLNKVFQTCMAQETDLKVLQTFATKLAAAGQTAYATAVQQKHDHLARFLIAPQLSQQIMVNLMPVLTTQSGATYSPTTTYRPTQ